MVILIFSGLQQIAKLYKISLQIWQSFPLPPSPFSPRVARVLIFSGFPQFRTLQSGAYIPCLVVYVLWYRSFALLVKKLGKLCGGESVSETSRPLVARYQEHYRSAANPTAPSYKNIAFSRHYIECHPGQKPKLSTKILRKQVAHWTGQSWKDYSSKN